MEFTGFHRLEKDLWVHRRHQQGRRRSPTSCWPTSRRSSTKANAEKLSPLQLANGAKELLDEVATGKITGEEDRYSHTDLWDFAANVEGSKAAVAALRPALEERDPALVKRSTPVRQRGGGARRSTATATAGSCTTSSAEADLKGCRTRSTRWPSRSARSPASSPRSRCP